MKDIQNDNFDLDFKIGLNSHFVYIFMILISCLFTFYRSHEQQHYFNTPFQLSLPPSNMAADVLSDAPESADQYEFSVEDGDVIMLATDGVFDNIPDSILVEEIGSLQNGTLDPAEIQVNMW